jgi:TRAP-type C4-dicarboxylate transport system permease small subunit
MAGINITKLGHNTESVIHWIAGVARSIASVLLALMVLLISFDVFGRYVLNRSIKGAVDIIEEILIFIVFFGMAEVAAKKENIKVDLITSRLSEGTQFLLYCFTSFATLTIAALMTWQLGARGWSLILRPTLYTLNLEIPLGPFYLVAALGGLLLCLELAVSFGSSLANVFRGKAK